MPFNLKEFLKEKRIETTKDTSNEYQEPENEGIDKKFTSPLNLNLSQKQTNSNNNKSFGYLKSKIVVLGSESQQNQQKIQNFQNNLYNSDAITPKMEPLVYDFNLKQESNTPTDKFDNLESNPSRFDDDDEVSFSLDAISLQKSQQNTTKHPPKSSLRSKPQKTQKNFESSTSPLTLEMKFSSLFTQKSQNFPKEDGISTPVFDQEPEILQKEEENPSKKLAEYLTEPKQDFLKDFLMKQQEKDENINNPVVVQLSKKLEILQKNHEFKSKLESKSQEIVSQTSLIIEKEHEIQRLQKRLSEISQSFENLSLENINLKQNFNELQQNSQKLENQNQELQKILQKSEKSFESQKNLEMKSSLDEISKEFGLEIEKIKKKSSEDRTNFQKELEILKQENLLLKKKTKELKEVEAHKEKILAHISEYEILNSNLQKKVFEFQESNNSLALERNKLNNFLITTERELEETKAGFENSSKKCEILEKENQELMKSDMFLREQLRFLKQTTKRKEELESEKKMYEKRQKLDENFMFLRKELQNLKSLCFNLTDLVFEKGLKDESPFSLKELMIQTNEDDDDRSVQEDVRTIRMFLETLIEKISETIAFQQSTGCANQ